MIFVSVLRLCSYTLFTLQMSSVSFPIIFIHIYKYSHESMCFVCVSFLCLTPFLCISVDSLSSSFSPTHSNRSALVLVLRIAYCHQFNSHASHFRINSILNLILLASVLRARQFKCHLMDCVKLGCYPIEIAQAEHILMHVHCVCESVGFVILYLHLFINDNNKCLLSNTLCTYQR